MLKNTHLSQPQNPLGKEQARQIRQATAYTPQAVGKKLNPYQPRSEEFPSINDAAGLTAD
ncbi:MAG TPA: hypothetical protein PK129_13895 [Cellvibrionaceae bacterium]|nr:hypothetical protein [Cellvibrionaceae bacterium]